MEDRIKDKINEIEDYLKILLEIIPDNFEEYKSSYKIKWSCEKGFQNIIEGITDLSFLIINKEDIKTPEDDINAFELLKENNIISEFLSEKLKEAKGMRNIIAHEYGKIDDEIVYNSIKDELEKDINEFIKNIKVYSKEII